MLPHTQLRPIPAEQVVQRQLDAYNARDIDALVATHADNAEQHLLHAGVMAAVRDAIRDRMAERFSDPALRAELVARR